MLNTQSAPANQTAQAAVAAFQSYPAANFENQTYEAVELCDRVKQAQSATDEFAAIAALEKHVDALTKVLAERKNQLQESVKAEHLKAFSEHAKRLGYDNEEQMLGALGIKLAPKEDGASKATITPSASKSPARRSSKEPKIHKWVLRVDATGVTADDAPGYERLPKDKQESGKYRRTTDKELAAMEAEHKAWEEQQAKKS